MRISDSKTNGQRDPDTFDVRRSIEAVADAARNNKRLIVLVCLVSVALMVLYIKVWPPVYGAQALLLAERDIDAARDNFYSTWDVFRKDDARSEIELMTAGPILKEVVEKEHLKYADVYHPVMSELTYLWQESWFGKSYKNLKDRYFPDKDAVQLSPEETDLAKTIIDLHAAISIDPVAESNVGRLRMKGPNRRVAHVANTLLDTYMARRAERYQNEARDSYQVLTQETEEAARELDAINARRVAFAVSNGVSLEFNKEVVQLNKLAELELDAESARAKIATLEASLHEVESELAAEPQSRTMSTVYEINTLRETTKAKRLEMVETLADLERRFRPDSPEVNDLKQQIATLDGVIAQASERVEKSSTDALNEVRQGLISKRDTLRTELAGARAGYGIVQQTVGGMQTRFARMPAIQTAMGGLNRDLMLAQEKYQQLSVKRAQAAVSQATVKAAMPSMRIVEYASPGDKTWPKSKILYPSALFVGFFCGVVVAVIKEYSRDRISKRHIGSGSYRLYGTLPPIQHRVRIPVVVRTADTAATQAPGNSSDK
jgi:uncharacterized protein involved in exopolysaccharide biosynthesis